MTAQAAQAAQAAAGTEAGIHPALEKHYTCKEVAEKWGWSETKVRDTFRDQPGVLRSNLGSLTRRPRKRQHVILRIPESVLIRVHNELAVSANWRTRKGAA